MKNRPMGIIVPRWEDVGKSPFRHWFLILIALLMICPQAFAQNEKVTIKMRNTNLADIFKEITKQSRLEFVYNFDLVTAQSQVSVDEENITVCDLLTKLLTPRKLTFEIKDHSIVIRKLTKADQDNQTRINRIIRGTVRDENRKPIVGATVRLKDKSTGYITDQNGEFRITMNAPEITLVFSFVGMETREVTVKSTDRESDLNITLKTRFEKIDDVVITGYGNIRRSSFTGSSTHVTRDELLKISSGNVIDALQVFDPSLRVIKNNDMGSNPNSLPEFYIRGRSGVESVSELDKLQSSQSGELSKFSLTDNPNTPIFILDGYEVSTEKIYDLDVNRIQSITILKDASSTAIYGSRASNGVIVVETIAPKDGELHITYNFVGSVTLPDLSDYNLMNASEKLKAEVLFGLLDGSDQVSSDFDTRYNDFLTKQNLVATGVDTYWLSKPLTTQFNHKHSLFLEGGNETVRYGIDLNYNAQNGVMKGSDRNTLGAAFSLDYKHKNLLFKNTISMNLMNSKESPYGTFSDYTEKQPYDRPDDSETGRFLQELPKHFEYDFNLNPLYEATLGSFSKSSYREFTDNFSMNWFILDGLQLKAQLALSYKDSKSKDFTDPKSGKFNGIDRLTYGELIKNTTNNFDWNTNIYLMYNNSFGKHDINFRGGFNAKEAKANYESATYEGFTSSEFHDVQYANKITDKPYVTDNHTRLMGFFASVNYTYDNIYLFDGSLRWDGSSEFGSDQRMATFWSTGAGINVHNYSFMQEFKSIISQFRLTANYGVTGKVNFPPYAARHTYDMLIDDWYTTGVGSYLSYMGNENLKWERQHQLNLSANISVWKNRLSLGFTWYDKRTKDLITDVSLPYSSGFSSYKDNMGEVQNRGYEFNFDVRAYTSKDLDVRLFMRAAHNKNKILKLSQSMQSYNAQVDEYFNDYNGINHDFNYSKPFLKYEIGGSLTSIFGMQSLGISPINGKELYEKRNGEVTYTWNTAEQQILGNTEPKLQGSFGVNIRYKNFTFYTSFLYECGGQIYNTTLAERIENVDLYTSNADRRVLENRWQKEGDITPFKNIKDRLQITQPTSRFVQDNNQLSFNSLSIGYDFSKKITDYLGIGMLRLQFNMKDVATFSTVKQERGLSYPFARTFDFTLNLGF